MKRFCNVSADMPKNYFAMKTHILLTLLLAFTTLAATPEQEKAFIDSYKKAFEASDTKALDSMMLTEGVTAEIK
jgi:hypothetical protein